MRTIQVKLYRFEELDQEAQEKAVEDYLNEGDFYHWGDDDRETLKAFTDAFPVEVTDWEYGYHNYINYRLGYPTHPDVWEFTGVRLLKYLINNHWRDLFKPKFIGHLKGREKFTPVYSKCQWDNCCVLTGYCVDDDTLQPLYDFLKKPDEHTTLEDLLYDCLQSWVYACRGEYEACQSFENVAEILSINEYWFTENGEFHS